MYTADEIILKIREEKKKSKAQKDIFLGLYTVLNHCSSVMFCSDHKKLIEGIHKETSDEDLITFYFALPIVVSSTINAPKDSQMYKDMVRMGLINKQKMDYINIKSLIESRIPGLASWQSQATKEKIEKLSSLNSSEIPLITNPELYSIDVDAALTRMAVEVEMINHDKKAFEYFWWMRMALSIQRRLDNAFKQAEHKSKKSSL